VRVPVCWGPFLHVPGMAPQEVYHLAPQGKPKLGPRIS
jgi:hypothetical protein